MNARMASEFNRDGKMSELKDLESSVSTHKERAVSLDEQLQKAVVAEREASDSVSRARASLDKVETESQTLDKILNTQDSYPSIVSKVQLDVGYEQALAAALGEDLEASDDSTAPVHWRELPLSGDPSLPSGVESLSSKVVAPASLQRRLNQIGLVDASDGDRLQGELRAGQRLVSQAGDLWRWDGFKASGSSTSAAKRLEQKNRLKDLDSICSSAKDDLSACMEVLERVRREVESLREQLQETNVQILDCDMQLDLLRGGLHSMERDYTELSRRHAALVQTQEHLSVALSEVDEQIESERAAHKDADSHSSLEDEVKSLSDQVASERSECAAAQASFSTLDREVTLKQDRLSAIDRDKSTWQERLDNAKSQIVVLEERISRTVMQVEEARQASGGFGGRRQELLDEMSQAQRLRDSAAEHLSSKEVEHKASEKTVNSALQVLQEARESHIRAQERHEAATDRQGELESRIRTELECEPSAAIELAGYKSDDSLLPDRDRSEQKLEKMKAERERLGAVNLQAEDEYDTIVEQRDSMMNERDDLLEAISRLRKAIMSLNKEGRVRLLSAFDIVNEKFQDLFIHLFGGGEARLELIESDDPLEAGLEILACPPGKKLQTMTLLSGGEQALTALALIFAVFLTNPAPICVLDEVDASVRRSQCRAFLQVNGEHERVDKHSFYHHHAQSDNDGPHGSFIWRDDGGAWH